MEKKVGTYVPPDMEELFRVDPYLKSHDEEITRRYTEFRKLLNGIETNEPGGLSHFSSAFKYFGPVITGDNEIVWTEWCPDVKAVYLWGDFNGWSKDEQWAFQKCDFGKWKLIIAPHTNGQPRISHDSIVKLRIIGADGIERSRISPWAKYVTQPTNSVVYEQRFWNPIKRYEFRNSHPPRPSTLRIYEAHVGIASAEGKVATFQEFKSNVLRRIKSLGYNCIQMMAVMEHAYYGSFGYQVSSFFAISSRFGTPEDLKELIDAAHELNLVVLLDIVHSHASKNTEDGLNQFNGTNGAFFHDAPRGFHSLWDSRLFDYSNWEVLRFLLSNLRWYIEEYNFDGFRFDGVTSMIYHSHGIDHSFTGNYNEYFGLGIDTESTRYLTLANYMLHKYYPDFVVTIAEEVSGLPALCRPVSEGGLGFDYKLAMAVPDMWIKILKHKSDEDWDVNNIVWTLINRRYGEKHVAYSESHDQALVGDKTIAFWLMDKEMYSHMSVLSEPSLIISRGIALHKMIRLLTHTLAGEAYLNFIGNEWGHPEWLDFPREGNNESYHYARRQWNLVDDKILRYKELNEFDKAMNHAEIDLQWLASEQAFVSRKHQDDKVIVFERNHCIFVFNFHSSKSFSDYKIGIAEEGTFEIVLSTDDKKFGGYDLIDKSVKCHSFPEPWDNRSNHLLIYAPTRTALILKKC